jgi:hypothetical protein
MTDELLRDRNTLCSDYIYKQVHFCMSACEMFSALIVPKYRNLSGRYMTRSYRRISLDIEFRDVNAFLRHNNRIDLNMFRRNN